MQIKTISYQRVRSLGNYESERLEATAEIEESEDFFSAFVKLKHHVEVALRIIPPIPTSDEEDF